MYCSSCVCCSVYKINISPPLQLYIIKSCVPGALVNAVLLFFFFFNSYLPQLQRCYSTCSLMLHINILPQWRVNSSPAASLPPSFPPSTLMLSSQQLISRLQGEQDQSECFVLDSSCFTCIILKCFSPLKISIFDTILRIFFHFFYPSERMMTSAIN